MNRLLLSLLLAGGLLAAGPAPKGPGPEDTLYPERAECAVNLARIAKRLKVFALANEGRLPRKLSDAFVDTSGEELRCLRCPAALPAVVQGGFYPSYAYVLPPDGQPDAEAQDILVFDGAAVHEDGRNVLLSDLETIQYVAEAEFQKALEEQRGRWEKAGKEFTIVRQDFIPLTVAQRGGFENTGRSFFRSTHFKICALLVLAMGVVIVLLALRSRKRGGRAAPGDGT